MADNKNQHFVPKCHMKPFASVADGSAIHLFNARSGRCIFNAPTRGQCSRSYFYGKDLKLEKKLGKVEGAYGEAIRQLADMPLPAETRNFLRDFTYLQHSRTEAFLQARQKFFMAMDEVVYEGHEEAKEDFRQEDLETARAAIDMFAETLHSINDLKVAIIINSTNHPFITSDNPAVHTNRLHIQRINETSFGLVQSGCLFIMPLTPMHSVICYDGDVYTTGANNGVIRIKKYDDVDAINQLQVISCNFNLYFGDEAHAEYAERLYRQYADLRIEETHWFDVLVPDGKTSEGERFRAATPEERRTARRKFIVSSHRFPEPRRWPSFLSYRTGAHGYTDGSAAGFVRHEQIEGRGWRKYWKHRF